MWVTQTYLGTVEPEATVFIYYLFEEYVHQQKEFTDALQRNLERMGEAYNSNVSLLMPNPNYADRIESEVREIPELWMHVRGSLPGLLIATTPLMKLASFKKDCFYLPFGTELSPIIAADIVSKARSLTDETLEATSRPEHTKPPFWDRLGESVELKPGLFGVRLDLKKLYAKNR